MVYIHVRSKELLYGLPKFGVTCVHKLASMPPITETFTENVTRADLETSSEECT